MLEDTFESMEDGEDMEEAAEEEVDKILFDITAGEDICSHLYITIYSNIIFLFCFYYKMLRSSFSRNYTTDY